MHRTIAKNSVFLILSQAIGFAVSLLSYKHIYGVVDNTLLVSWIALYEISVLFTLTDPGISQSYIKKSLAAKVDNFKYRLARFRALRLFMLISGIGSIVMLMFLATFYYQNINWFVKINLIASIFISVLGYTDTAELRVRGSFQSIYIVNIISSVVFIFTILINKPSIEIFSIAVLLRSITIFILQFSFTRDLVFKYEKIDFDFTLIFLLNIIYLAQFTLDSTVISGSWSALLVAPILVGKRFFDGIKGLIDAFSLLLVNYFNHQKSFVLFITFSILVGLIFCALVLFLRFFSSWIIKELVLDFSLLIPMALYYIFSLVLRLILLNSYFTNKIEIYSVLFLGLLIILIKFMAIKYAYSPESYFYIQAISISIITFVFWRKNIAIN